MKGDILYVLTTPAFFVEGRCGRVSHACGFVSGAAAHGSRITLLSGPGAEHYVATPEGVALRSCRRGVLWWPRLMLETLRLLFSHRLMVVRWRPVIPFLFWPLLLINRNVWVEVNALTGIDSNKAPVRLGVRLAVWLTTRLFHIITVSDVSMDRIKTLARPCRRTYVMPNGFNPDQLVDFEPLCDPRVPPWLVYFGKEQPYYDWELLYQAASELTEKGVISGLRLFGVDRAPSSYPSVFAHGAFDRDSLVRALSSIENPILVVHSSASDTARATSPVKLFEYAALALPIICSSSMSRQAGRLHGVRFYPAGDQSGLVEAIHELAVDYPLARERAVGSRDVAMAHYTWPAVVSDWHKGAL